MTQLRGSIAFEKQTDGKMQWLGRRRRTIRKIAHCRLQVLLLSEAAHRHRTERLSFGTEAVSWLCALLPPLAVASAYTASSSETVTAQL